MNPAGPPVAADPWTGRVIGRRWKILSLLDDSGGMASVYLADDTTLVRKAVVKIPKAAHQNAELRERFAREAFWHAQVENLHVVHILDRGEEDGTPFLVLQYLPGGNLKAWSTRNPPFLADPQMHFESWLLPVAQALDAVAAKGLVHRDVKPTNILFDAAGKGYLSDFGIVKAAGETTMTLTDMVVGTVHFMSPEQYQPDLHEALDGRSDQYGLAVTVYLVLTGWKYPVTASAPGPIVAAKLGFAPLIRPIGHDPGIPVAVDDAVMRALSTDRDARFASCVEFAKAVRDAFHPPESHRPASLTETVEHRRDPGRQTAPATRPPTPPLPSTPDPPPPPGARPWPAATWLAAAGALAVACAAGVSLWSGMKPDRRPHVVPDPETVTVPRQTVQPADDARRTPARSPVLDMDTVPFERLRFLSRPELVESWLDAAERDHPGCLAATALRVGYLMDTVADDDPDAKRRAKSLAESTLRRHPDDPWANLAMAIVLRDEKRTAEALDKVDVAIRGLPGRPDPGIAKIWMLTEDTGRHEEGMALARDLADRFPTDPRVHNALGTRLFNAGDFAAGLVSVRRACDLAPDVAIYWNNLGYGLSHLERFEEAVEAYGHATDAAPQNPQFHLGKAAALNDLGREDESLASIDEAIRVAPRDPQAYVSKARGLWKRERTREAVDVLSRGLAVRPDEPLLLAARAQVHLELKEPAAALEDAMRLQRITGDVMQYGFLMAIAQAGLDRWTEALDTASRIVDAAEGDAALTSAYTLRIQIYRHLGREGDAKADEQVLAKINAATSQ